MHTSQSIARNSIVYTGALVVQRIASTIYFWYYSNNLPGGAGDLGRLQFVLSYATLFFIIGDLGLYLVFVREASRDPKQASRYLETSLAIKIPLFVIAGLITLAGAWNFHREDVYLIALSYAWVALDSIALFLYGALRAFQKLIYESAGVIIAQSITVVIGVVSIKLSGDIRHLLYALIFATVVNIAFVLFILYKKFHIRLSIHYNPKIGKLLLKSIPAFAAVAIVVKILNTIDVVLLRQLSSDYRAVGFYSIPLKIVTALSLTIPTAFMGAIYPSLSHLHGKSDEGIKTVFRYAVEYLLIISVPISVGFFALGDELINALFRDEYTSAIIPSKIILLSLPFIFLSFPTGNLLNATNRQKYTALSRVFGAITLIGLNVLFIPRFALMGAAYAFLATYIVILVFDIYFARAYAAPIFSIFFRQTLKVVVSSGIMYGSILLLSSYAPWYFLIILGCVVYFVALFLLHGINVKFLRHL
ncbi:MAG: flippase [Candidatus Jacksonbacteria bacterium]|nr:flippase [Candidatus Jacksonbacteria bacterium]